MLGGLGVDGGASKTHALVVDEQGYVRGFGSAGTGNHQIQGLKSAMREIRRAARAATEKMVGATPDLAAFCLAGADLPEDYAMLQKAVNEIGVAPRSLVRNDTLAALRAGLTRSWGVVVICGSGFNSAGRAPDGCEIILPGLGPDSGDWGGGGDLGQEMIRLVMRAWDGRGQPTLLTDLVLQAYSLPSVEALLTGLYHGQITETDKRNLVPLLFDAAEAGDEVARGLVIRMGTEVGVTARTLICRLGLSDKDVDVILGGSVFRGKGSLLLETAAAEVHSEAPYANIRRAPYQPVVGAALIALDELGVSMNEAFYANLEDSLPAILKNGE